MPSDNEIRAILREPGTSQWIKDALSAALDRDPVDAVNDAELLAIVLRHRAEVIQSEALALNVAILKIERKKYDKEKR
jgi:hypothetical protein